MSSGDKFFCRIVISESAGDAGSSDLVHNLCHLLLNGRGFCEEQCY